MDRIDIRVAAPRVDDEKLSRDWVGESLPADMVMVALADTDREDLRRAEEY